jgi:hypothetical protein
MFTMRLRFSVLFITLMLASYSSALADPPMGGEVQYFNDPELNYWKTAEPKKPIFNNEAGKRKPDLNIPKPTAGKSQFPWNKYLSQNSDEFFKEGDYTPPAPFMEIARNPSDENIENWFRYLETKNVLLRNLQERLTQYSNHHPQPGLATYAPSVQRSVEDDAVLKTSARIEKPQTTSVDAKNYRMRLYFDSHCPHCQKMLGTVADLMRMGYWVELKQVDKDTSIRAKIPFSVSDASPQELKQYQIEAVPVLLIGNLKKQNFAKVQGYHEAREIIESLTK